MESFFTLLELIAAPTFFVLMGFCGALALVAVLNPGLFKRMAETTEHAVDTNRVLDYMEKPIHIDHFFLRHSRVLGVVTLAAVAVLGYAYTQF